MYKPFFNQRKQWGCLYIKSWYRDTRDTISDSRNFLYTRMRQAYKKKNTYLKTKILLTDFRNLLN